MAVDFVRPWDILLRYKALEGSGVDGVGTKKEGKEGINPTFPPAWRFANSVRSYFEEKLNQASE